MLSQLIVQNFALIDRLEIDFSPGLTVLTGETGAGKSIMVRALQLVLGGRATADFVRAGAERAQVSVVFRLSDDPAMLARLAERDLDDGDELILRRVIQVQGPSRAYINGRPATVAQMAELAAGLVDISGQHQHTGLLRPDRHLDLLDRFGGLIDDRAAFTKAYEHARNVRREREDLEERKRQRLERLDFLRFQLQEIDAAELSEGEEETLEQERELLANAEKIRDTLGQAMENLDGAPPNALDRLRSAHALLQKLTRWIGEAAQWSERLESARLELDDITASLSARLGRLQSDPQRLDKVQQRLEKIRRLCLKHGGSVGEILQKSKDFRNEIEELSSLDERGEHLEQEFFAALETLDALGNELTGKRQDAARRFERDVERRLAALGMAGSRFRVNVEALVSRGEENLSTPNRAFCSTGADRVEFLLSANKGQDLKPLKTVASGGELSRIMLAVKEVLLDRDPVATCVFDEVDSGIGGVVAGKVGDAIGRVAGDRQVICITHLPQIAAYGETHFKVAKYERDGSTVATLTELIEEETRLNELARMMAGDETGPQTLEAARLLRNSATKNRQSKQELAS